MKKIQLFLAMLFVSCLTAAAQSLTVSGKVTYADDGSPVIGATIEVKGTNVAVLSDVNGAYKITVPANAQQKILVFSFTGLQNKEVTVQQSGTINVVLEADTKAIDEVVITTAYGTAKKSTFTGSAAVVKSSQITAFPTASFTKALDGVVPGVQVTGSTGQPGSGASVTIRGVGSVNASNSPLYVVDGAPYDGNINSINNDDIESISILKDAVASALYGARGANGVIIVTTKKGKVGKPIVSAKLSLSVAQRAIKEYDRVSAQQYMQGMYTGYLNSLALSGVAINDANKDLIAERLANISDANKTTARNNIVARLGGYNPFSVGNTEIIGADGKFNPAANLLYSDDWGSALAQNGLVQDYNASVGGGSENATYLFSIGYLNEQGYVRWSDFERFTGRMNVTAKVTNWFKVDANISATSSTTNQFLAEGSYTTNPFYYARVMAPIYPIYQRDASGKILYFSDGAPIYDMGGGNNMYTWAGHTRQYAPNSNLLVTLPADERGNRTNQISARVGGDITFLKDFSLRIAAATDIRNIYYSTVQNKDFGDAEAVKGRSTREYLLTNSLTINQILNYNKQFGKHTISALAGHESYMYKTNNLWATRTGFIYPTTELIAGAIAEGSSSSANLYTIESYLASANYNYDNKYFASGSLRYDGSSRFAAESRWGLFYSFGGSWRITGENFMEATRGWLDDLRLKASYGEQGNDNIGTYYGYQNLYSIDDRNNANASGAWLNQLGNPDLKWEKNTNINVGLDFRIANRVYGGFEWFMRKSDNLLFDVPLPRSTGIASIMKNVGSMQNTGVEFQVGVDIIKNSELTWSANVNITSYTNKITKLPENAKAEGIIKGSKKLMEGYSFYEYWLRDYAGVDPATGDALFYKAKVDANGKATQERDGVTRDANAAGYFFTGDALPKAYGGFNTTVSWKGFDFSAFLTYQIGGLMYDTNYSTLMHPGTFGTNWSVDILNAWQKAGDITDVPRLQNANAFAAAGSSRWLTDASFLSLRNLTLGYNLPKSFLQKIDLQGVRVFVSGENLGMLSKRQGMDPQQTLNGTTDNTYVPRRTLSVGLNLTF